MRMNNSPEVKLAIVGVSRDCFPIELTRRRLAKVVAACRKAKLDVYPCRVVIENESDAVKAAREVARSGANSAVIYLGNFGPEGPLTIFARKFGGPVMLCAAAEESKKDLINGRGDAFCGMLNASYNFGLRNMRAHIPQMPVALPDELAVEIKHFAALARIALGARGLKIFSFGPRPQDFYACNAPIKPLYDLDIEVMENSELDLLQLCRSVKENDSRIKPIAAEMKKELKQGNTYPSLLEKLARYEIALTQFHARNLGSRQYGVFANKCWPAFERAFGFVPCYVNSRLATQGIPVACEVDIYGALSEYLCQLASDMPATLLDVNNTVPGDLAEEISDLKGAAPQDLFMGFHCGNTPSCCMKNCGMKFQLIMNRLMEDASKAPDITRGTLEGQLRAGPTTFFRLQAGAAGALASYIAEGNVIDVDPHSFGGIGVLAIPNFARFYRHALIGKQFPHHAAIAFAHCGKALFDALKLLGVRDISVPLPPDVLYPGENPF